MNRTIFWDQNQSRTFDYVEGDHDVLYALAYAMQDLLGSTSTVVSGFAATAASPATLSFTLAAGRIYQLAEADATAIGAIPQDTTQIFQQGATASQTITLTPPGTAGQSQWNLVEAQFSQVDSIRPNDPNGGLLYFYNSANPSQPFQGPNNDGQTTNTLRSGVVVVQVVQGSPAATGSEVPPNPTSGWVPLYLVDLSNGQTQITQGEILAAGPSVGTNVPSNYPSIPTFKLLQQSQIQNGSLAATFAPATTGVEVAALGQGFCNRVGTAITANYTLGATDGGKYFPVTSAVTVTLGPTTIAAGETVGFLAEGVNITLTTASGVFKGGAIDGSTSVAVPETGWLFVQTDGTNWKVVAGSSNLLAVHGSQAFTASGTFTVPTGVTLLRRVLVVGGGGGSWGSGSSTSAAGAGGGGFAILYNIAVTPGQQITVSIGAGGLGGAVNAAGGSGGTTSFGSYVSATGGQSNANQQDAGAAGNGVGGDVNGYGGWGALPGGMVSNAYSLAVGGSGGSSFLSGMFAGNVGAVSNFVGGPGAGAPGPGSGGYVGVDGLAGFVEVEW